MNKISKTIVFFGNEKLATGLESVEPVISNAVVAAGFEIEKTVTGKLSELGSHKSQLAVLAAYGQKIPQSVLDEFPLGIINIHPSLLPLYRGSTPIESAMLDGVTKTGVSIMRLVAGMDEGPIYKQKTIHLTGDESKAELTEQLQKLGARLLVDVLPDIANRNLKPRNQTHPDRATYCNKIEKSDGVIDWNKPAEQIAREIRAYLGWPGSRTELFGKDVIITKVSALNQTGRPGSVTMVDKSLVVSCSKGSVRVENLKPAGKKEMTANEFIAGYYRP